MRARSRFGLLIALAALAVTRASAQAPAADWRTIETAHFRVHFPRPWEAWSGHLAVRLEAIREAVSREVGFAPPEIVDVVVADPEASANGSAWPLLGAPRMVLWTTPPEASSLLANFGDWTELLAIHEYTHLAHLGRPSRNPLRRAWSRAGFPFGPLAMKSPRWVSEGYATLLEGRLSGRGRPYSELRAAVLRAWAAKGRLPSYGRLDGGDDEFLGGSMAYLAGSAYLEWLEAREEPGSLGRLWRRLSARLDRDFDGAFAGVYGERPADLYARFAAETTAAAIEAERSLKKVGRDGTPWAKLAWRTGAPAVSPDGSKIALVLRERKRPARLAVFVTIDDAEALRRDSYEQAKLLRRDPDDVAAVRRGAPERKPRIVFEDLSGDDLEGGRFLPDGRSLVFVRFRIASDGTRHRELWVASIDGKTLRRATAERDLADPDPSPDGARAVAVRDRHGRTEIVVVDLRSGGVRSLVAPSIEVVYAEPRFAPDGASIAVLAHRDGRWRIELYDAETGAALREIASAASGEIVGYAWSGDGRFLDASVARDGGVDLEALPVAADAAWHQMTRSLVAALAPAPAPDGKRLFYLALDVDGLALDALDLDAATPQLPDFRLDRVAGPPIVPPRAPASPLAIGDEFSKSIPASRPFGHGRMEIQPIVGGAIEGGGGHFELGARAGDLLGRTDIVALGAVGSGGGPSGGAIALALRRLPVEIDAALVAADFGTASEGSLPGGAKRATVRGAEIAAIVERSGTLFADRWQAALAGARLGGGASATHDRRVASLAYSVNARLERDRLVVEPSASARLVDGIGSDAGWRHLGGALGLTLARGDTELEIAARGLDARGDVGPFEELRLGGGLESLTPPSLDSGRILEPALPRGALVGTRYRGEEIRLRSGGRFSLFARRHRMIADDGVRATMIRIVGVEATAALPPLPVVRLPAIEIRAGVGRVLDAPLRDRWRAWIGLALHP